jgi:hypothetical protein
MVRTEGRKEHVNFRGRGRGGGHFSVKHTRGNSGCHFRLTIILVVEEISRGFNLEGGAMDRIHACSICLPVCLPVCLSPVESLSPPPPSPLPIGE